MSNDGQWKAIVAGKQLEIDKLKHRIKEMENDNTRLRADKTRKKTVRVTESSDSDK